MAVEGSLDWQPFLFTCDSGSARSGTLRLAGEAMTLEWDNAPHEEFTRSVDLAGEDVDLDAYEADILS
ncbi:hypothetical protein [Streptomyces profundus]|uniref:hypothetical protein n=1 Tax=Streptomyces profundus TaxID=2867410 RepID=UPI001D169489|nr:hypothetical protein [Streptomyces sp. MA3_2.13]UED82934.1 hypothetical protein K4G22_00970 [Streptomyces sp. MA3_2.13]